MSLFVPTKSVGPSIPLLRSFLPENRQGIFTWLNETDNSQHKVRLWSNTFLSWFHESFTPPSTWFCPLRKGPDTTALINHGRS